MGGGELMLSRGKRSIRRKSPFVQKYGRDLGRRVADVERARGRVEGKRVSSIGKNGRSCIVSHQQNTTQHSNPLSTLLPSKYFHNSELVVLLLFLGNLFKSIQFRCPPSWQGFEKICTHLRQ